MQMTCKYASEHGKTSIEHQFQIVALRSMCSSQHLLDWGDTYLSVIKGRSPLSPLAIPVTIDRRYIILD